MADIVLSEILVQHAEDAAFLWTLRQQSLVSPKYDLNDLAALDDRLEAHLDGLRIGGEQSWSAAKESLKLDSDGDLFVLSHIAFDCARSEWIEEALKAAIGASLFKGLVSALGWLPCARIEPGVQALAVNDNAEQRNVAVATQAVHRVSGDWAQKALNDRSALVQARACRAVGDLGRVDLVSQLQALQQSKDEAVAFWSCWSAAVLGDVSAATALKRFATSPNYAEDALAVGLRRLPLHAAKAWIEELAQDEVNVRSVIQGVAIIGDPAFVPGLIAMMSVKDLARIAAESFCDITGVNLVEAKLEAAAPAAANEDDEAPIDPDEFLPWPDVARVSAWWDKNAARFNIGTRYLLGKPVTAEHLQWVLHYGNQKLRHGAALELAMLSPGTPIFNTAAPAWVQQKLLGLAG